VIFMAEIAFTSYKSPFGKILVASSEGGVCEITFSTDEDKFVRDVSSKFQSNIVRNDARLLSIVELLDSYFKGKPIRTHVDLDLRGTDFQRQVWSEVSKIPYGETRTYKEIAYAIKRPKASRAVGNAVGSNPVPLIIPCHRVVLSNGSLGGYAYGTLLKRKLLEMENVQGRTS